MYKFQLLSDIHLEFGACKKIVKFADNLILAGDICYPEYKLFTDFLMNVSKTFNKVFYITGNHEYYQNWKKNKNKKINNIEETNNIIKNIVSKFNNVYFLDNDFYDFDDNLRIIGSTLWTNISEDNESINDSYQIYLNKKTLINDDYIRELHNKNVLFIEKQIKFAKENNKKLLVISHHLPSYQLILEKYKTYTYNAYNSHFASNLDYLMDDTIKAWCAGHSHGRIEKTINNVPCYINAFGYPKEERNGATLDFTFEIDL